MPPTRIFVSYSHDSEAHKDFVLDLTNRLIHEGLNCELDRYINGSPPEGWPRWMEKQIEKADFVLVVCTPTYLKRFRGEDRNNGYGAAYEGAIISQTLYDAHQRNHKFIPILPVRGDISDVPQILKSGNYYRLMDDYHSLYRVLTNQPEIQKPQRGQIRTHLPVVPSQSKMASTDANRLNYRNKSIKKEYPFITHGGNKGVAFDYLIEEQT